METPTQPLRIKAITPGSNDEPSLSTALGVLAGFVIFAGIIFLLVIYNPW